MLQTLPVLASIFFASSQIEAQIQVQTASYYPSFSTVLRAWLMLQFGTLLPKTVWRFELRMVCQVWQLQSFQMTKLQVFPSKVQPLNHIQCFRKAQPYTTASTVGSISLITNTFQAGSHSLLRVVEIQVAKGERQGTQMAMLLLMVSQMKVLLLSVMLSAACQLTAEAVSRREKNMVSWNLI